MQLKLWSSRVWNGRPLNFKLNPLAALITTTEVYSAEFISIQVIVRKIPTSELAIGLEHEPQRCHPSAWYL